MKFDEVDCEFICKSYFHDIFIMGIQSHHLMVDNIYYIMMTL
jgi:hypothetical protein